MASFVRPTFDDIRMFLLVWGDSGAGKTTLASTAPGEKAYVQFDPGGYASLSNRTDFHLLDLSGQTYNSTMMEFNNVDPFGMRAWLKAHPEVETIVIDSITTLATQALQYAVTKTSNSSFDVPGRHGYGTRNNVMRRVVQVLMQIAGEFNKNLIMITHESSPDEITNHVTMSLSLALANDVSLRFNEVWWMKDDGNKRMIYIRPFGVYKPMKSRMFTSNAATNFIWEYDADTLSGEGIADWMDQWRANGGKKIPLPVRGGAKK